MTCSAHPFAHFVLPDQSLIQRGFELTGDSVSLE